MTGADERGTTAVELVVAAALTVLLLAMVLPIVVTAHRATGRALAEDHLHGDARSVLTEVVRRLRSARAPAVCVDPPGAPVRGCHVIGPRLATLLQATADRVCASSQPNTEASGVTATVLAAPELVCLGRRGATAELVVSIWSASAVDDCEMGPVRPSSYTTPCWVHAAPRLVRSIGRILPTGSPLLRYRSAAGVLVEPPGPPALDSTTDDAALAVACPIEGSCLARDLAAVATVEVDLRLGYRDRSGARELRLVAEVAPRGSALANEQTWAVA